MKTDELKKILEDHALWLESRGREGKQAVLCGADLTWANLVGANLARANLTEAKLAGANLARANLTEANLAGADFTRANLAEADLVRASLVDVKLLGVDLSRADLSLIRADLFSRLRLAPQEAPGLLQAVQEGRIDGQLYVGKCACFVGTIANLRKESPDALTCGLKPEAASPTERWFLAICPGDTPESSQISRITAGWIEEFLKEN